MKKFDRYIKDRAAEEQDEIPALVKSRIEETLAGLPEGRAYKKEVRWPARIGMAVACVVFVTLFLLPNVSVAYAKTLEQLPLIGDLVRVITIRNYFYSDEYHEMEIAVPELESGSGPGASLINAEVEELTGLLVDRFYKDLEDIGDRGHSAVYVDYEIITDTHRWFTLKIRVHEAAGSSNTYYRYYHLDKLTGKTVRLGDIVEDEAFYEAVEAEIKRRMREAEQEDSQLTYWEEVESVAGRDFVSIDGTHNFYWSEKGDLVIPFDKYEVAPGYMGTPEFSVDREVFEDFLKEEFKEAVTGEEAAQIK